MPHTYLDLGALKSSGDLFLFQAAFHCRTAKLESGKNACQADGYD
jgi:hypothetical protein